MKRIKQFTSRMLAVLLAGTLAVGSVSVSAFGAEDAGSTVAAAEEFSVEEATEGGVAEPSSAETVDEEVMTESSSAEEADGEVMAETSSAEAVGGEAMSETSSAEEVAEGGVTELPDAAFADTSQIATEEAAVTSYTVTLDANGGYFEKEWDDSVGDYVEQAEVVVKQIPVGGTVTAFPTRSEQNGQSMVFAGWSLERDGELVSTEVEEYTPVESCGLYAAWKAEEACEKTEETAWGEVENVVDEDTAPIDIAQDSEKVDEVSTTVAEEEIYTEDDVFDFSFDFPETDNEQTVKSDQDAFYADGNKEETDESLLDSAHAEIETDSNNIESTDSEEETVSEEASNSVVESGTCGDNLTWTLDEKGKLTISGVGNMSDYNASNVTPWENSSINNICISEGVESIGSQAFTKCINLKSIEIPSGVTRIGQAAFKNCYNLKDIKIPSGLKYIDLDAFYNCSSLNSITIPKEPPAIGNRTFYGCSSLECLVTP